MNVELKPGDRILFQGDSITDAGRDHGNPADLGFGYVRMVAAWLGALLPERNLTVLNRGIGGNRVVNLRARWQEDTIAQKPDILSIMVGINDTWRRYDSNDSTSVEKFEDGYRWLLTETRSRTSARLILIEPFVLHVSPDREAYREDLDPKRSVVRHLADEFGAVFIPMDSVFLDACAKQPPSYWAADGVHPTLAGHALIARQWLDIVGITIKA